MLSHPTNDDNNVNDSKHLAVAASTISHLLSSCFMLCENINYG